MSGSCCWRCSAGVGGCRGVGYTAVHVTAEGAPAGRAARAPSFDSLVRPVRNGPLAQRIEPARQALMGASGGVGALEVSPQLRAAYSPYTMAGGTGGALAGAVAGATLGSFIPGLGTLVGMGLGGLGGALGLFGGNNAAERRKRNMALLQTGWSQAKYLVLDQITRTQRRLDVLDRDLIALSKTITGLDAAAREAGPAPGPVLSAINQAKQGQREAVELVSRLQGTEDDLNAKAATAARGEQSGQTGLGGEAQVALDRAKTLAGTVDAQAETVARGLSRAVQQARVATSSVNRWVDQQNAQAQAAQAEQQRQALLAGVTARLQAPPPGFVFDERGGLMPVQGSYASSLS